MGITPKKRKTEQENRKRKEKRKARKKMNQVPTTHYMKAHTFYKERSLTKRVSKTEKRGYCFFIFFFPFILFTAIPAKDEN